MNNLSNGKIVIGLSFKVFEELLQTLQSQGLFGALYSEQQFNIIEGNNSLVVTAHIDANLEPAEFKLTRVVNGTDFSALRFKGNVKLSVSSPTAHSPVLFDLPFIIGLKLGLALKPKPNRAPVLGFVYNGIDTIHGPLPREKVTEIIESPAFMQMLSDFELDILDPVIDGLEEILFLNETKPNRASWAFGLHLMPGDDEHPAAYVLIIDVPGGNVSMPIQGNFVPKRSEIIVQFTSSLVQAMVAQAREELTSWFEDVQGVDLRVDRLNLTVNHNQLYLDANIVEKEYDVEVHIHGPIKFSHSPGGLAIALNVGGLETDIDLPWWADVILYLVDAFTLGFAGANSAIHDRLPNMAQLYAQNMLNSLLPKLSNALKLENLSIQGADLEVYPDLIELNDGAITAYIQVLINPLHENLKSADYSKLRERFVMFHLESGRQYMANHLAQFMQKNLVVVTGYHQVGGKYVRSNPDNIEKNNLEERYGR